MDDLHYILVSEEATFREGLIFLLSSFIPHSTFKEIPSIQKTYDYVKDHPHLDFMVVGQSLLANEKLEDFLGNIMQLFQSVRPPLILVICEGCEGVKERTITMNIPVHYINKEGMENDLIPLLMEKFRLEDLERMTGGPVDDYALIKVSALLQLKIIPCDVFLRLGDQKFVKVFKEDGIFKDEDYLKYNQKDIEFLHIKKKDTLKIFSLLNQQVHSFIQRERPFLSSCINFSHLSLDIIQSFSQSLGWDEKVQKLASDTIDFTFKTLQKIPQFTALLNKVLFGPDKYLSSHSTVVSFVACGLSQMIQLPADSAPLKLVTAAILHDLGLEDDVLDERGILESLRKNPLRGTFKNKSLKAYLDHPLETANMIRQWPNLPPDVEQIVAQHHERPDGSGFPKKLTAQRIHPLAAIFILSEDIVDYCFEQQEGPNFLEYIQQRDQIYDEGAFKRPYQALKQALMLKKGGPLAS